MDINSDSIRKDFPILNQKVYNNQFIYFDNAATTLKPISVINKIKQYYNEYSVNVHRSIYNFSEKATMEYENTRNIVKTFLNANNIENIIFTKGTTESINLVAYAWGRKFLKPGDEILITEMEHHSNIVPWQICAKDTGATIKYIPVDTNGELKLNNIERYFSKKTKIVSFIHQSNVLGTINPILKIIKYAKDNGTITFLDCAQSIAHENIDIQKLNCDFLAFSGHKMLGPTGVGVLYGRSELLHSMNPFLSGGEMISDVSMYETKYNEIPWKFEAGTPNIAQVIGLGEAINYISSIGFDYIKKYENKLLKDTLDKLSLLKSIKIYGNPKNRGNVISFNIDNIHSHDIAEFLDKYGIAIRSGNHCAQPLLQKLNITSTARASFYIYNTKEEIDFFIDILYRSKDIF